MTKKANDTQQAHINTMMILGLGTLGFTWENRAEYIEACKPLATKCALEYGLFNLLKVGLREGFKGRTGDFYDILEQSGEKLNDAHLLTAMKHWYKNGLFL